MSAVPNRPAKIHPVLLLTWGIVILSFSGGLG
uniref:Uncharacterized protein n=1 Tax=Anguilla anguilla TaxID=7936 RepID=A0A0E9T159_ANGAN